MDVAIYEAVAALMESTMADYELGGVVRTRSGSVLPGVSPSNVYPTTVVSIVERTRGRIREEFKLSEAELFPKTSAPTA